MRHAAAALLVAGSVTGCGHMPDAAPLYPQSYKEGYAAAQHWYVNRPDHVALLRDREYWRYRAPSAVGDCTVRGTLIIPPPADIHQWWLGCITWMHDNWLF